MKALSIPFTSAKAERSSGYSPRGDVRPSVRLAEFRTSWSTTSRTVPD
jgi:hypothetical protein